jgi:hypothetical protein
MAHTDRIATARLESISSGKPPNLKESLYKQLKEREWIFNRMENNWIFLMNKDGAYGVVVRTEDIDWNEPSTYLSAHRRLVLAAKKRRISFLC